MELPKLTTIRAQRVMLSVSGGRLRVDDDLLLNRRRVDVSLRPALRASCTRRVRERGSLGDPVDS